MIEYIMENRIGIRVRVTGRTTMQLLRARYDFWVVGRIINGQKYFIDELARTA